MGIGIGPKVPRVYVEPRGEGDSKPPPTGLNAVKDFFVDRVGELVGNLEVHGLQLPAEDRLETVSEGLSRGSQPSDERLNALKAAGYKAVVNLQKENPDEGGRVAKAGLRYL